jgi:glycosyltransferase involved in cell wall biosynthesis
MSNTKSSSRGLTLSVGIPTLNQANFLRETLDSLLNQTCPPDEILVSDHYSTDNTQEVLAAYAARFPNLRIVQPPPGSNLTTQYNFTLSSLTGDWITLLSSDDIARPNFCETLLRGAARTADAALVRAGWENIDSTGKVTSTHYILSVPHIQNPPGNLTAQKHGPTVNFAAFAIKREAFHQSGSILASLQSLSDWALFLQLAPFGSYVYEHALISGYRVGHDGNKNRDRVAVWTHDQRLVFTEVMPLAAQRCGMTDQSWIGDANRYNFIRYLARASREFAPHEREPVIAYFQTWANSLPPEHSAEAAAALRAFAAGEVTRTSIPFTRRAKTFLKPVFQRFHTILRRS